MVVTADDLIAWKENFYKSFFKFMGEPLEEAIATMKKMDESDSTKPQASTIESMELELESLKVRAETLSNELVDEIVSRLG